MVVAATSVLAGLRILVVEDEYIIAEAITMMLEDFGCIVVGPIATIEEAIAAVNDGGLDGALLDANLHGHSSAPVGVALRAAAVPFIVATGYGTLPLEDALNRAPRISKPFNESNLYSTLITTFHKVRE